VAELLKEAGGGSVCGAVLRIRSEWFRARAAADRTGRGQGDGIGDRIEMVLVHECLECVSERLAGGEGVPVSVGVGIFGASDRSFLGIWSKALVTA
jgi:hypothetical protein